MCTLCRHLNAVSSFVDYPFIAALYFAPAADLFRSSKIEHSLHMCHAPPRRLASSKVGGDSTEWQSAY